MASYLDIGAIQTTPGLDIGALQALGGPPPAVTETVSDSISLSDALATNADTVSSYSDSISLSDSISTTIGVSDATILTGDILAFADLAVASFGVKVPPSLRGNIDYDQIRATARSGDGAKLLTTTGSNTTGHGIVFDANGNAVDSGSAPGGGGTVTSVAQTVPSGFTVTGSPVTTSGTLAITLDSQAANKFLASPDGSSGTPNFRIVVAGDLPLASSSAFGAVKVDNTTITAAAGVISAVSSSGLVLLEQHTASSSASLAFTTAISGSYDDYMVEFLNILPATNSQQLNMQWSTSGSYVTSGYSWSHLFSYGSGTSGWEGSSSDTAIALGGGQVSNSGCGICGSLKLYAPAASGTTSKSCTMDTTRQHTSVGIVQDCPSRGSLSVAAIDAFKFFFSSGNITSGTIRVYGLAK